MLALDGILEDVGMLLMMLVWCGYSVDMHELEVEMGFWRRLMILYKTSFVSVNSIHAIILTSFIVSTL